MPNAERKILAWVDAHLTEIVALALSVMGLIMRLPLKDHISADGYFFLLPWYDRIKESGLRVQVGDYNFLYQFLIYLMTKLSVEPLYAYKSLSILFDYLMAAGVGLLVWNLSKDRWKSVLAYGIAVLSPIVVLNSAAWGQCDSIFCCFAVFALLALLKEKWGLSMILLGLALSFKLQAIFLLPVFLFVYYQRRKFSLLYFGLIPVTMCLTGLPMAFFGRNLLDMFSIYSSQTGTYPFLSMNYPSIWLFLAQERSAEQFVLLKVPAMLLTVAILAVLMILWLRKKTKPTGVNLLIMAFLMVFTCVLFLPSMHERYGYLYEILAIALAVLIPQTIPLCAGLVGISLCTYGSYLFKTETFSLITLTVVNLVIYGGYLAIFFRQQRQTAQSGIAS